MNVKRSRENWNLREMWVHWSMQGGGIIFCLICYICNCCEISDDAPQIISCLLLGIGSIYIAVSLKRMQIFFVRILVAYFVPFLDVYGRGYVTILHSGSNSESFYRMACMYCEGDYFV